MKPYYSWAERVLFLIALARDMRKDKDNCTVLTIEMLEEEKYRFIALLPDELPPTCREVIEDFFNFLYDTNYNEKLRNSDRQSSKR